MHINKSCLLLHFRNVYCAYSMSIVNLFRSSEEKLLVILRYLSMGSFTHGITNSTNKRSIQDTEPEAPASPCGGRRRTWLWPWLHHP